MNGNHLLDTNILIALFNQDAGVCSELAAAAEVFVPAIALGELYFGAQKSVHVEKNRNRVRDFADQAAVLACDAVTAEHYGEIKHALKRKGRPLPENDVWIAALAKQHRLIVVTRDEHFQEIDDLPVERW